MKLWTGRISKDINSVAEEFNSSIAVDSRMYKEDILGSVAHAQMLGKTGIISPDDEKKITDGLRSILKRIESGELEIDPKSEDIHTFVEQTLTKEIGDAGKKLHTARSRNDQVATDLRLYTMRRQNDIDCLLKDLVFSLSRLAVAHCDKIMPGYTHLQRAQPVTFGHYMLSYAEMFIRDRSRLSDAYLRTAESPLGACALAGTTYDTDPEYTAKLLGFSNAKRNSLDAVSDRDFVLETAFALSLTAMHLSRFSEELIMWCSGEFGFIKMDDSFSTGSSIMPQKKNPDIAELIRGKTGRVYGDLFSLLTVMKSLPLAYNKDMQEDKELLFDAFDTEENCLRALIPMIESMEVNGENMRKAAAKGFINATDCADYLVTKGVPFRDAYKITGELVNVCEQKGKTLEELEIGEYKKACEKFEEDIYERIDLNACVSRRKSFGGPSPENVRAAAGVICDINDDMTLKKDRDKR